MGKNLWVVVGPLGMGWHIHLSSTGWFVPANELARSLSNQELMDTEAFLHPVNQKGVRLRIHFNDGQVWNYVDPRTWGKWYLRTGRSMRENEYFRDYGPDWLLDSQKATLALQDTTSRRTVKDVLCDQRVTAGIGNYLACEICFLARIHPHQRYNDLSSDEKLVLASSSKYFIDLSMDSRDHSHWNVFGKAKELCPVCKTPIGYVKDSGGARGSYFCPSCQGKLSTDQVSV